MPEHSMTLKRKYDLDCILTPLEFSSKLPDGEVLLKWVPIQIESRAFDLTLRGCRSVSLVSDALI